MKSRCLSRVTSMMAVVAVVTGSAETVLAQDAPAQQKIGAATIAELQRIVDAAAAKSGAAGVQVSVILGNQRADFVAGTANAELGLPMTVQTVIQVGSTTKVLNAAMIMTLVDEGVLNLDRPVRDYIPNLALADEEAARTITLRQLLSMTSGLDNGPYQDFGGGEDGLARYVAALSTLPQAFPPGKGWGYSNTGATIAGYAAERVAGQSWDALLKKRILDPIGLIHAVTRAQDLPFQRVSAGHTPGADGQRPRVVRPWYLIQSEGPSGSTLAMSAQDLASFGRIFLQGGKTANGVRVLSEAAVATMMTPVVRVASRSYTEHWCIGLEREHWSGTPVFGHAGGNASGTSYLKIFPERNGVLALTINTPAAHGAFVESIFDGFGAAVFKATRAKLAKPATPVPLTRPDRYVGTYSMLGMTYEVAFDGKALTMRETRTAGSGASEARSYTLIPLETDVFLLQDAAADQSHRYEDVGFFGDDGQGRATNLTAPLVPAKRIR